MLISLLKSEKNLENSSRKHELTHFCLQSTMNDFRGDILNAPIVVTNSSRTSTEASSYSTYLEIPGSLPQLPKRQKTQLSPVQPSTGNISTTFTSIIDFYNMLKNYRRNFNRRKHTQIYSQEQNKNLHCLFLFTFS